MTRLHRQLANLSYRVTLRRMAERHHFAGLFYPMNDNAFA